MWGQSIVVATYGGNKNGLLDCIKTGDIATFREVLAAHLMTVNKSVYAKKIGIGRRTLYDLLDPKKEFNPEFNYFRCDKISCGLGVNAPVARFCSKHKDQCHIPAR